jgi:ABC-type cobalamin transport system permease subunit
MKPLVCTIKENARLAKIAAGKLRSPQAAIVIGRTIYIYGVTDKDFRQDMGWLRHEVCHVRQYQRYTIIGFIILYLFECLRKGYYNNRFEREARQAENNPTVLENVKLITARSYS